MRVLVTGAAGLLGPYIYDAFLTPGNSILATSRNDCDLSNRMELKKLMLFKPDVVVHTAAMTNVDDCEREPIKAFRTNRDITAGIVGLMPPTSKLVYISTDMVYSDVAGPHGESEARPINTYGKSKFAGEACAQVNARHLVLRTNFFGKSRSSKLSISDWVVYSLTNGHTPLFYSDSKFSPIHMKTLANLIVEFVEKDLVGIYNVGAVNSMSKAEFARCIAFNFGLAEQFGRAAIGPSSFLTNRPKDLSMDVTKIREHGFQMPTLEDEIEKL